VAVSGSVPRRIPTVGVNEKVRIERCFYLVVDTTSLHTIVSSDPHSLPQIESAAARVVEADLKRLSKDFDRREPG
jgi:hypothetical protein